MTDNNTDVHITGLTKETALDALDATANDDLRELVDKWRDGIEPVGGLEQRHQTLSDCADQLEELIGDE